MKPRRGLVIVSRIVAGAALVAGLALVVGSVLLGHEPFVIPPEYRAPVSTSTQARLRVRYAGVTGYEISDGETVIVVDPTHTRPTLWRFLTERVRPDEAALARMFPRADYVLVNHAHHDHGADAPAVARRTGAVVIGTRSTANLARARGLPEAQIREVTGGEVLTLGTFTVRVARGQHSKLLGMRNFLAGTIPPDAGDLFAWQYGQDGTLVFHLQSKEDTLLFHPSASYAAQDLPPADTVIFGVAGEGLTPETVELIRRHTQPRRFLPTHYDNFLQARELGLSWLPTIDFEDTARALDPTRDVMPWWILDYDQTIAL